MLVTILLVVQVSCEWVEISQQHYRKPITPKRVHPFLATLGNNEKGERYEDFNGDAQKDVEFNVHRTGQPDSKIKFKNEGTKENVFVNNRPNDQIGKPDNVKLIRPQNNAKIKTVYTSQVTQITPTVGSTTKRLFTKSENQNMLRDSTESVITTEEYRNDHNKIPKNTEVNNNNKHNDNNNDKTRNPEPTNEATENKIKYKPNRIYFNHPTKESFTNKDSMDRISGIGTIERVEMPSTRRPALTNQKQKIEVKSDTSYHSTSTTNQDNIGSNYSPINTLASPKAEFVTQEEIITEQSIRQDVEFRKKIKANLGNSVKVPDNGEINTEEEIESNDKNMSNSMDEVTKVTFKNDDEIKEKAPDESAKSIENLKKFIEVVAETISKNTRRSFKSKMRYLQELKDSLMFNIEQRIETLYPEGGRQRRGSTARGHVVDFPSSEGALMTISFLTFAVFLIKLVLQVIHTYKNKAMMLTPIVATSVGRAAAAVRHQRNPT